MQGLAAGLAAVEGRAEIAFVCSTDMPFLHPAFVRRVLRAAHEGADVGLPVARGYPQPLAAAYRTALAPVAGLLVDGGPAPARVPVRAVRVTRLDEAALREDPVLAALDPDLDSVVNVNEPGDYANARARPAPEVTDPAVRHRWPTATAGPSRSARPPWPGRRRPPGWRSTGTWWPR